MDDARKNSDTSHLEQQSKMLKEVEYYSTAINTWISTRFERDKSLLNLSAGAIGLIFTFLVTLKSWNWPILLLSLLSLLSFCGCLFIILNIFSKNADHIDALISNKKASQISKQLKTFDTAVNNLFKLGVIFSALTVIIYIFETSGLFSTQHQSINIPASNATDFKTKDASASSSESTVKAVPLAFQVKNEPNNMDTPDDSKQINACAAATFNKIQSDSTEGLEKLKPKSN